MEQEQYMRERRNHHLLLLVVHHLLLWVECASKHVEWKTFNMQQEYVTLFPSNLFIFFQSAGDLLQSARLCLLVSTFIILLSLILLTSLSAYLIYRRLPPRSTPSIVHTLFPDRNKSTASTWTSLPFPISSFSWFVYLFPFPSQVLMISLGYLSTALSQFTIPVD